MGLFASLIVGTIAGWLAGKIWRGEGYGFLKNLILGLVGSAVGSWLGGLVFGVDLTTGINLTTIVTAAIGAVIVVWFYERVIQGKRT